MKGDWIVVRVGDVSDEPAAWICHHLDQAKAIIESSIDNGFGYDCYNLFEWLENDQLAPIDIDFKEILDDPNN